MEEQFAPLRLARHPIPALAYAGAWKGQPQILQICEPRVGVTAVTLLKMTS